MKKAILLVILLFVLLTSWAHLTVAAPAGNSFFEIEAVDTMKYSRDTARNASAIARIPELVAAASLTHPTHIAIATPYNDEFIPVTKKWVDEIRKHNIKVWYRGNFAEWEQWFGYPPFNDPYEHISKTERFIKNNPGLFKDGDIFTPVPEPENGGFGDPRQGDDKKQKFFDFLPKSYDSCVASMKAIKKNVKCGYFSVNGDVARMFTKEDVNRTGGVLVIDHYVKTPEQLVKDIKAYHETTGAKIVLGEYGAPIPDIHGELTEDEQNELIRQNLMALVSIREMIGGINYWTAFGGSTEIYNGTVPKKAVTTIESYFNPLIISGNVQDEFGGAISAATVSNGVSTAKTNILGNYSLMATPDHLNLKISRDGYKTAEFSIKPKGNDKSYTHNVALVAENHDFWYYLRKILHGLTTFTLY